MENRNPSAFIPFCAFAGNMAILGKQIEDFRAPVCTSFKTKVLGDQQCYELALDDIDYQVSQGYEGGISFVMDYNEDRDIKGDGEKQEFMALDAKLTGPEKQQLGTEHYSKVMGCTRSQQGHLKDTST